MRTSNWTALSALALALSVAACGDSGGRDDAESTSDPQVTSTTPMTSTTTEDPPTTGETTNDSTTTTVDPPDPTTSTTTPDPTTTTTTGGELSCESYCEIYAVSCKDFSEYDNTQACLDQCGQWPVGTADEIKGDSLGCRTYHVEVAGMVDANVHCPHAGPNGAGECVDPAAPTCADYCAEYFKNCVDDLDLYDGDMDSCMTQCATWYPGFSGQMDGDTVGCREYHAGAAFGDPVVHCPHAGPGGANVCVITP